MQSSGLLLVNKPSGPTSHDIVDMAREKLGVRKIGHTGTLDPFASGLLILLVSKEATKRQIKFLKMDKTYLATAMFGYTSDTYDVIGKIESKIKDQNAKRWSLRHIDKALKKFQGEITQTVPAFSAVKRRGKKLYELARKGQIIKSLPKRKIKIYVFKTIGFPPPSNPHLKKIMEQNSTQEDSLVTINFIIKCSSGTYIRSLIHDLGKEIGCGALVGALHRTKIGNYSVRNAIIPEEIDWKYVMKLDYSPADTACSTNR